MADKVRCHDCRRLVPIGRSVLTEVEVGRTKGNFFLGWGLAAVSHLERVVLCEDCADYREVEEVNRGKKTTSLVVIFVSIAILFVVILPLTCMFLIFTFGGTPGPR